MGVKAAIALCTGGPIAYLDHPGPGVTNKCLLNYVVPHMLVAKVPFQACIILGRKLLWKVVEAANKPEEGQKYHLLLWVV